VISVDARISLERGWPELDIKGGEVEDVGAHIVSERPYYSGWYRRTYY